MLDAWPRLVKLGKIRRYSFVEVSKALARPRISLPPAYRSGCKALSYCSSTAPVCSVMMIVDKLSRTQSKPALSYFPL